MKNLFTILIAISLTLPSLAQNFFSENFDGCTLPTNWTNTAVVGDTVWVFGDNALGTPDGNVDGTCMAYVHDDDLGSGYPAVVMDLISPVIDLSSLDTAELRFDYIFEELGASYFAVALWNGTDWDTVFTENTDPGCFGFFPTCSPRSANINITDHLIADFQMKFIFDDGNGWNWYIGLDNVAIHVPPTDDGALVEAVSPVTGCGLTATEPVWFSVYNNGQDTITSITLSYSVDGNTAVSETFSDTILSAQTDTLAMAVPVDLSVPGTYNIQAWLDVPDDANATNDTITFTVENIPVISALPYAEDFESGSGGWYSTGEEGIWEMGDPEGALIDTANSGVNAWATNLNTLNYVNNQLSYLISPCFDFSALLIDPILEFAFISNSEVGWDGMWLEASTDAGATWATVGNFEEPTNWYNNENEHGVNFDEDWWDGNTADTVGWIIAEHLLDGVAGSADVILRFVFDSDASVTNYEGFAIDDINVSEQPAVNAELAAISGPISDCGMTANEQIGVTVNNLGSMDMDSIIVSYSLNNGPTVTEVFNQALTTGSSTTLTLANTIDLSVSGDYDLTVWVTTIGDGDTSNDTATVLVTSIPTISTIPYNEDFESGTGGWSSVALEMPWELGDPEGILIDTAYSGINAWATNLNTLNYENSEISILNSPCFDFSGLTDDPVISFAIIYNSEFFYDGAWLEVSTNGGLGWTRVGNLGEGENWYSNDNFFNPLIDQAWAGVSGNNTEWIIAEHILDGVAGNSEVRVRFIFNSDASVNGFEGFAVDAISIHPQPQLDLVALSFNGPQDGCSLDQEAVSFTFWNKGLQTVSNFDVGFMVDNGSPQTETYTNSVAQGDTVSYTFNTELADLSVAGPHTIDVFTALAGDENMNSDTLWANTVINHEDTPLSQTETPGLPISSTIPEGTTSQMFFCGLPDALNGCLEITNVTIDSIQHTWLSDLTISLISPAGDTVELTSGNGGAADDMSDVVFTDESTNDITLQIDDIMPGTYHTEDPLGFGELYDGQDPNGAWSLFVQDLVGGDDGILVSWSMTFTDNNPTPQLAYADTNICLTQVLTVGVGTAYDSYIWSTGDNTQQIQLFGNILGLGPHEISVIVDQAGCTGVSNSFILTVDACTGIAEVGNLSIGIYPNPTNGEIVLDISGESRGLTLEITDTHGKAVYSEFTGRIGSGLRQTIDLRHLANGMYFLKLDDGNDSVTKKIIKQ